MTDIKQGAIMSLPNRQPCNLLLIRQIMNDYSNVKQPVSHLPILNQADSLLPNVKQVASEVVIVQSTFAQIPDVFMLQQSIIKFPIFQTVSGIFDRLTMSHFC